VLRMNLIKKQEFVYISLYHLFQTDLQ